MSGQAHSEVSPWIISQTTLTPEPLSGLEGVACPYPRLMYSSTFHRWANMLEKTKSKEEELSLAQGLSSHSHWLRCWGARTLLEELVQLQEFAQVFHLSG